MSVDIGGVHPPSLRSMNLTAISVLDLLALNRQSLHELKRRGVVRTFNQPQGDIAERLVADAYDGELARPSEKSYDVQAGDRRLQVKASVSTPQLSAVRSFDFTHLVVVVLSTDTMAPLEAREWTKDQALSMAKHDAHSNSYRIIANRMNLDQGRDITEAIKAAAAAL
jgi:hypothetical protein